MKCACFPCLAGTDSQELWVQVVDLTSRFTFATLQFQNFSAHPQSQLHNNRLYNTRSTDNMPHPLIHGTEHLAHYVATLDDVMKLFGLDPTPFAKITARGSSHETMILLMYDCFGDLNALQKVDFDIANIPNVVLVIDVQRLAIDLGYGLRT